MLAVLIAGCHKPPAAPVNPAWPQITPFNFQITEDANDYQIEGYLAERKEPGPRPAMLVLNGEKGNARECIKSVADFATMGIRV
ncbi:MAG: hypothetical protein ACRETL_08830, partial [Gammaproteobacteria bacterium]